MSDQNQINTAMLQELQELRDQVRVLREELLAANQRVDFTMRGHLRCPGCGCRRIAHAMSVMDRGHGNAPRNLALYRPRGWFQSDVGELEAYVCTQCGLVEWYAKDPDKLSDDTDHMRILDGAVPDDNGPYR